MRTAPCSAVFQCPPRSLDWAAKPAVSAPRWAVCGSSEKIGAGAGAGVVFRSRVATAESGEGRAGEDLVLTRILWLEGAEEHNANTRERYIYIHGTNHEDAVGRPASHGCVRMRNADIIELFELVAEGAEVRIEDA